MHLSQSKSRRAWARRIFAGSVGLTVGVLVLFAGNGLSRSWRVPGGGSIAGVTPIDHARTVRVMAFNLAKCDFYAGGGRFVDDGLMRERLDRIVGVIAREQIDVACLSEVVFEAGFSHLDQAEYLARKCGFARFATGDNYDFGLPCFSIRTGNAVLSRFPLAALKVVQLPGARPFYKPTNNRRIVLGRLLLNGSAIVIGSVRNDSFDQVNNCAQTRMILELVGAGPALLAGDFNAGAESESIALVTRSARFCGSGLTNFTFPASAPDRRLDYVFAPADWSFVEEHVIDVGTSDHLAVVTTFALP